MLKRILLGGVALASLAGLPAHAATTITQKNCVVYSSAPTSGSPASALVPCDFLTDGTNVWPAFLPWDGTTFAGVAPANTAATAAQGGLVVTMEPNSAALAVTGTFWQTTQPVSGTFWQATQPVSGTFWQATQPISGTVAATESGTWTVQPGNTANTTAWLVTGTGGTFPATQSGTWNIGSITTLPALTTGAAIIGKVGIDQTTPGTTNGVQVNAALPAGTNLMGKVGIDQTTPGTTNAVAPSTPVGSATLATGQSAGFTTSTLIVAARTGAPGTGRHNVTITNLGTVDTFCGNTGVTTSTGELLVGIKGASITLDSTAAIYCAAGSSSTVSYVETY